MAEIEGTQLEALGTTRIIKDLLKEEIYDKKEQKMRPVRYGDIVILLASPATDAAGYIDIFRQQNIPLIFDTNKDYFNNTEVDLMMNLLAVIDNDRQDIPLLAVMRSSLFDFGLSELLQIRAGAPKTFFYEAVQQYLQHTEDALSQKLRQLYDFIKLYREKSKHMRLYDLLLDIYNATGFCETASMMEEGRLRSENLKSLLNIAREYEKGTTQGVFGFLRFVEKVKTAQADINAPVVFMQRQNAVRVMSIHKSKGLEFPVVILGRTSKRFNRADLYQEMILHKQMGPAITYYDVQRGYRCDSLAKIAAKQAVKNEMTSEQIRLLYVALSRAEERLIITGLLPAKSAEKKMASWSEEISTYKVKKTLAFLDWIMSAAIEDTRRGEESVFDIVEHRDLLLQEERSEEVDRDVIHAFFEGEANSLPEKDIAQLAWRYDYEASTQIAEKVTVSELKQTAQHPGRKYADFAADEEDNVLPMRRGVIVHYIMQTIDLKMLKKTADYSGFLQQYLRTLLEENIITAQEASSIDIEKLATFWSSNVGQLILDAQEVRREVEFYYKASAREVYNNMHIEPDEKVYIQGVVDCIAIFDGVVYIIDYKTDRYHAHNRAERIALYATQLKYYQRAYREITKTDNVKCILCFINMEENILLDETENIYE